MKTGPLTRPSLLIRVREPGNGHAWEEFVRIYAPLIHGFCRQRGLQEADSADVTQEVMKVVVSAIRDFEYDPARGAFRNWLLTVTRNKISNCIAEIERRPQPAGDSTVIALIDNSDHSGLEAQWEADYRSHLFRWASERVRAEVRPATWQSFWQTAVEDRPAEAVAKATGLSPGAVYVARSRVTMRLRQIIESVTDDRSDFGIIDK
jgi:RNA polymerase sigma factor (sigma-70 family)